MWHRRGRSHPVPRTHRNEPAVKVDRSLLHLPVDLPDPADIAVENILVVVVPDLEYLVPGSEFFAAAYNLIL